MNFLKKAIGVQIIKSFLSGISADAKTTFVGALAAAVLAADLDFGKLLEGDPTQVGKVASALALFLVGYFTNKKKE